VITNSFEPWWLVDEDSMLWSPIDVTENFLSFQPAGSGGYISRNAEGVDRNLTLEDRERRKALSNLK
jgi:hypothetical protein